MQELNLPGQILQNTVLPILNSSNSKNEWRSGSLGQEGHNAMEAGTAKRKHYPENWPGLGGSPGRDTFSGTGGLHTTPERASAFLTLEINIFVSHRQGCTVLDNPTLCSSVVLTDARCGSVPLQINPVLVSACNFQH